MFGGKSDLSRGHLLPGFPKGFVTHPSTDQAQPCLASEIGPGAKDGIAIDSQEVL